MYNIIEDNKKKYNLLFQNIIDNIKITNTNKLNSIKKIFDKITYKLKKYDNNINNSLNILLDNIQKLLGTDILLDNKIHNLYNNIYVIDHDYTGTKLETPIQIYENENKFRIVENHIHYKKNVIIYTMQKNTKYELFYDQNEKILLGYREVNKEYNNSKKYNNKIEVNYSIKNIILQMGFTRSNINITDFYPELYGMSQSSIDYFFKNQFNMNIFLDKIVNNRYRVLKKIGSELKKYINRIKFKYKIKLVSSDNDNKLTIEDEPSNNILDIIFNKYQNKINDEIITENEDKNIKHIFMKYINDIVLFIPSNSEFTKDKNIKLTYL